MGFEVVVRPAILPNIRPAPAQSLPPLDDPDEGFAVIRGNGAQQIGLSSSWSSSTSRNQRKEIQRRVDKKRVYQQEPDGTVNRNNYVDLEEANKIWYQGSPKGSAGFNGDDADQVDPGRGFTGDDIVPKPRGGMGTGTESDSYCPSHEKAPNIEVLKKDVIKKC